MVLYVNEVRVLGVILELSKSLLGNAVQILFD